MPTAAPARPANLKSFKVSTRASRAEADREPLPFVFEYRLAHPGTPDGTDRAEKTAETKESPVFHARPWLITDNEVIDIANIPHDQRTTAMYHVFEVALGDEYDAFDRFVHDPKVSVEMTDLLEVVGWMVEEGAGRPTRPS